MAIESESTAGAITARGLRVTRAGNEILHGIDLDIAAGTIYGLLGPSGAGKTTLIRAVMGLQRHSGEITVLGSPAGSKPVRGRIGYMAQAGAVYMDLSVIENLRFFAAVFRAGSGRVEEVLGTMRLTEYRDRHVWRLSGGQQRRVSLGCALVAEPEVLMLDEPTVGLDPVLRKEFWDAFHRWAAAGTTLLVSSHVMDEADRCDRLLMVREGRILADAEPDELLRRTGSAKMEEAFLRLAGEPVE